MNGIFALILAFTIVGAVVLIPRAIRYDQLLAELEALEDGSLAAEAVDAWAKGQW